MKLFKRIMTGLIFLFICDINGFASEKLVIVYTNSLNGYMDYCHCKSNPRGGLVKRATEIKKIREKYGNILLIETGDFFAYDKKPLLAKQIIKSYRHMGYDAVQFGDQEFTIGVRQFAKYRKSLPFVCNNIKIRQGKKFISPYKRFFNLRKKGIRIGIIGTISKGAFKYYPSDITSKIKVQDQETEIKKDINSLKKNGVDLVILLSHSGYEADIELAKKIPEIDVVVGGHSQTLLKKPVKQGKTVIVQAGTDGAHIGILELEIEKGEIEDYSNSFRLPDEFRPKDDTFVRRLINEYISNVRGGK